MQYGVSVYEGVDNNKFATDAYSDEDRDNRTKEAESAWLQSIAIKPTAITYRNLAVLETQRNNPEKAEEYYDLALTCKGAFDDFSLSAEYLGFLGKQNKKEKLWQIFESLPENCKKADRVRISAATAAVKLDQLDYLKEFFEEDHYAIREGENSLTDIWFEFCARRMAKERGITCLTDEILDQLIDEAWQTCPPDYKIDFRMSFNRTVKYRT